MRIGFPTASAHYSLLQLLTLSVPTLSVADTFSRVEAPATLHGQLGVVTAPPTVDKGGTTLVVPTEQAAKVQVWAL